MKHKLKQLADYLSNIDLESANAIYKLAGRHDKIVAPLPLKLQPAYKYIMYLKCMRNLDDETFHRMKRRYVDTSRDLQDECQKELDKVIYYDARQQNIPSSTVRVSFLDALSKFESDQSLWDSYFKRKLGKRRG
jgi:hypothetical protein